MENELKFQEENGIDNDDYDDNVENSNESQQQKHWKENRIAAFAADYKDDLYGYRLLRY